MGSDDTHVYTDHRNLLYVFHPTALEPNLGRHVVSKLQRWALYLSQFPYHIEHVSGEANVMADIMTRWFQGYRGKRDPQMARRVRAGENETISPFDKEFELPTIGDIKRAQQSGVSDIPKNAKLDDGVMKVNHHIWLPPSEHILQMQVMIMAHCGISGHRGVAATTSIAMEQYIWSTMKSDCREFVQQCLHCMTAASGEKIPRPLSSTVHGSRPNEVIHFDYLYMGPGVDGIQYVLLIKDDFSSYSWLVPCRAATAEEVAKALSRWIRVFTPMNIWVSDQGSHLKNRIMDKLAHNYGVPHKIYCRPRTLG